MKSKLSKKVKDPKLANSLVKSGMIATMGATVYSGFAGSKLVRLIHPWVGLAMVGFSVVHYLQNTARKNSAVSS